MPDEHPIEPMMAEAAEPKSGLRGLLATTGGKIVAIAIGLAVLGAVAGIVAIVVVFLVGKGMVESVESGVVPVVSANSVSATSTPGAPGGGGAGSSGKAAEVPAEVSNSEVFTFRDIFKPLITEKEETDTGAAPGSADASQTAGDPDTLYLQDIRIEGGEAKAVLSLNGVEYVLAPGEVVGTTPWKVLSIDDSSDTVVMLYGDSQITLTVGQGTSDDK